MREIKFRAIHTLTKHWFEESEIVFQEGKWYESVQAFLDCFPMDLEYVAVMQYTGLKDKNGVEIYEGDVLKWNTTGYKGVVFFDKYMFVMGEDEELLLSYEGENIEVIGNRYEDPGLVENES